MVSHNLHSINIISWYRQCYWFYTMYTYIIYDRESHKMRPRFISNTLRIVCKCFTLCAKHVYFTYIKNVFFMICLQIQKWSILFLSLCARSPSLRRKTASYFHRKTKQNIEGKAREEGRQSAFYFSIKTFFPSLSLSSLFPSIKFCRCACIPLGPQRKYIFGCWIRQ